MDISTVIVLASLLFGAILGDAVIYGKTMHAAFTLPKSVEAQGFTQDAAENIFISEFARGADIPSILPFPTVAQASKDSILSVVAKPLKIEPIVELLQDKFGAERVSIKLFVANSQPDGNLAIHALISSSAGLQKKLVIQGVTPFGDLIEQAARVVAAELLPYRVSLGYYSEGLAGRSDGFRMAQELASKALLEGFNREHAQQRAMLFNVVGLIAAQNGDLAAADAHWADGMQVPMVPGTAKAILAANRAFLAVARKEPNLARDFYQTAMASKKIPYLDYFDLHLDLIKGLILWSEGQSAASDRQLFEVQQELIGDTALVYRARLLSSLGRENEAKALIRQAQSFKSIRITHPDLVGSVFWVDPVKGGVIRR